jgi:hypothetical protein
MLLSTIPILWAASDLPKSQSRKADGIVPERVLFDGVLGFSRISRGPSMSRGPIIR